MLYNLARQSPDPSPSTVYDVSMINIWLFGSIAQLEIGNALILWFILI